MSEAIEQLIVDYSARIGIQARLERIARSQLEQVMSSLENVEDEKLSLLVTAAFAFRQAKRLGGQRTANIIGEAMEKLYENNCGKEQARKMLGLAKWVYESFENKPDVKPVSSFKEYIDQMVGRR